MDSSRLDELEDELAKGWLPTVTEVRELIDEIRYWRDRAWLLTADKASMGGQVNQLRTLVREARESGGLLDTEANRRLLRLGEGCP